jgi:hypothetical protein
MSSVAIRLGLLESVDHSDGEFVWTVPTDPSEDLLEAVFEEAASLFLAILSEGIRYEFVALGREHGPHQFWVNVCQRSAQPHVEEVRQIGIGYIVIIRRVGG